MEPNEHPKRIEISRDLSRALQSGIGLVNAADVELGKARALVAAAETKVTALFSMHNQIVAAIVQDNGHKAEDFTQHQIVEEDGKCYLQAVPTKA